MSDFADNAKSPDLRVALEAVRDRLVDELLTAEGSAVAALSKQLTDVVVRLDAVRPPEVSALDQLATRRAARRGTEVPDAPAKRKQRRTGSD